MDSFNNPFSKLNIYVINANTEMIMIGIEKIVVVFNKNEITNYSQFIEKLNEIFSDYGIVDSIYNKEGFKICEFNNLKINNIWNYIANNDTIQVSLNYLKDIEKNNNDKISKKVNNNLNLEENKQNKHKNENNNLNYNHSDEKYCDKDIKKENVLNSSYSLEENIETCSQNNNSFKNKKNGKNINEKNILKNNIKSEKKLNDLYNYETKNLLGKKRKEKNKNTQNNIKETTKNNKIIKIKENNNSENNKKIAELNYELIPSDKIDDINFLQINYPKLFVQGTNIKFKIQELLKTGIGVGDYHFGIIDNFNSDNNSFLIKNCNSLNEKTLLFMYQCDEENLMIVELKNFVEIWIEAEKSGKNYLEKDNELTKHFIRRQVEFYFCDKNYEKDNFLKKNEDENGFIPINVIMNFNKIQMITKDNNEFIEALKEEGNDNLGEDNKKSYELNQDFTKIRKRK